MAKPQPQTIEMTAEQAAIIAGIPLAVVLNFRDYGQRVVVVTRYGQKIIKEIPPIPPSVKGGDETVSQPISMVTPRPGAA